MLTDPECRYMGGPTTIVTAETSNPVPLDIKPIRRHHIIGVFFLALS